MKVLIEEYGMVIVQFLGGMVVWGVILVMSGTVGWKILEYNIMSLIG